MTPLQKEIYRSILSMLSQSASSDLRPDPHQGQNVDILKNLTQQFKAKSGTVKVRSLNNILMQLRK
jgi:hypothetical protein